MATGIAPGTFDSENMTVTITDNTATLTCLNGTKLINGFEGVSSKFTKRGGYFTYTNTGTYPVTIYVMTFRTRGVHSVNVYKNIESGFVGDENFNKKSITFMCAQSDADANSIEITGFSA
jgi:hypothetical protein